MKNPAQRQLVNALANLVRGATAQLYMPVGTLFAPVTAGEQAMAGYAANVQVSNPQTSSQTSQTPPNLPNTAGEALPGWLLELPLMLIGAGGAFRLARRPR